MTPRGYAQLIDFEGEILHAYQDSRGFWTIGVGHLIDKRLGGAIPQRISRMMYEDDIAKATAEARANFDWFDTLSPVRQDFIVCMIFNIGIPRLRFFRKMIDAIERQDWASAGMELLDSAWSRQVGPHRSEAMRRAIVEGVWD